MACVVWLLLLLFYTCSTLATASPPTVPERPSLLPPQKELPPGEALIQDVDYNTGAYGQYVAQTFATSNVTVPRLNMMRPFSRCNVDGSLIFIAPRGEVVEQPTAAIYDADGSLIWALPQDFGDVYNLQVQQYRGEPHLTFWAGNNSHGHGRGQHFILDKQYNIVSNISTEGTGADLHTFTILPGGTALVTTYEKVDTDLADVLVRPSTFRKWMWDCIFQEINLDTGAVVFQWRASDHFSLAESYTKRWPATEVKPWDWFHINSVEKDGRGNYLVSSRHLRCIAYISGDDGRVLWKLGGKKNSFKDLSKKQATTFVGQHDVHWDRDSDGKSFITLFDNRADWEFEAEHVSKGKRIAIDLHKMTAKLNATFVHPEHIFAFSQGSYQTLPNGNVLLGYGYTGAVAEFSPNGTLLCDAYFQPSTRFSSGDVQSYRNLKFPWNGFPTTKPSVVLADRKIHVSWLGATEVRSWQLQDSNFEDGTFRPVLLFDKTGFETQYHLPDDVSLRRYIRLAALDAQQKELGTSAIVDATYLATVWPFPFFEGNFTARQSSVLSALLGVGVLLLLCAMLFRSRHYRPRLLRRWQSTLEAEHEFNETEDCARKTNSRELVGWIHLPWRRRDGEASYSPLKSEREDS